MVTESFILFVVFFTLSLAIVIFKSNETRRRNEAAKRMVLKMGNRREFLVKQQEHNKKLLAKQKEREPELLSGIIYKTIDDIKIRELRTNVREALCEPSVDVVISWDAWIKNNKEIDNLRSRIRLSKVS